MKQGKRKNKLKFNKIVFDCDSTLTTIEGIDELARIKGKYKEVERLTNKAMNGEIKFSDVFSKRLNLIQPEKKDLIKVGQLYIKNITPKAKQTIKKLKGLGLEIYLLSGGYKIPVEMLARYLKIKLKNVFSNQLYFTPQGSYKSFDKSNPLCKNNGKEAVLQLIKQKDDQLLFIGDGMNDFKARKIADQFIAFTGVVKRKALLKKANFKVKDLTLLLDLVIDNQGQLNETSFKNRSSIRKIN